MKKWILALTIAGGVLGLSACNGASSEKVAETKAGDVSQEELYNVMKDKFGEQALQQLVYEKVLSKKYKVTDKELDEKIEQLKADLGANFEMTLQQYGYKSEADLKKTMKLGMLQEKAAMENIKVSDKELKDYFENTYKKQIKARHILVEDEATANEVKAKLDAGEKFEDVSNTYSTDQAAKAAGGDLGWFGPDAQMDEDFLKAAFALKANEISAPVKSQFGYHIIEVTETRENASFDKVKKDLEKEFKSTQLTSEKINEVMQKELKEADVKIKDKDLKDALNLGTAAH
ncbi:peptidylprolyl isomerase [Neobacillus niacini]|uniref:peptidylprolyl isomerase n=1 Tax=Neobacillus niacini TaxID=86668 RepID=UPI0021CB285E|nr:peptidylprolyl isomerase [Neobacillus niacini]MCM3767362.1 peptidylprolyl isomerase [Neobacillus niacini]